MSPGHRIISAKSYSNNYSQHGCLDNLTVDLIEMGRSSMAKPNVAGAEALVHQYFNSSKCIDNVLIDGATTRALIINSARHLDNSKTPNENVLVINVIQNVMISVFVMMVKNMLVKFAMQKLSQSMEIKAILLLVHLELNMLDM